MTDYKLQMTDSSQEETVEKLTAGEKHSHRFPLSSRGDCNQTKFLVEVCIDFPVFALALIL